ncbi:hypothetical protein NGGBJF_08875 [Cupriavidus necator]
MAGIFRQYVAEYDGYATCNASPRAMRRIACGGCPECPQECPPHALAVAEAGIPRDHVNGVAAAFHHQPGRFHAQVLHGLGRGLPGLIPECAGKLARAQVRRLGKLIHRELPLQVLPRKVQRGTDAVRARFQVQQRRELRLPAGPGGDTRRAS